MNATKKMRELARSIRSYVATKRDGKLAELRAELESRREAALESTHVEMRMLDELEDLRDELHEAHETIDGLSLQLDTCSKSYDKLEGIENVWIDKCVILERELNEANAELVGRRETAVESSRLELRLRAELADVRASFDKYAITANAKVAELEAELANTRIERDHLRGVLGRTKRAIELDNPLF